MAGNSAGCHGCVSINTDLTVQAAGQQRTGLLLPASFLITSKYLIIE